MNQAIEPGNEPGIKAGIEAEILSIGTELLTGETGDTNAGFIATQLRLAGIAVSRITAVGDDRAQLSAALREIVARSQVIITSGGLGPTEDDITRDCVAEVLGETPSMDDALKDQLSAFFKSLGREMPASNLRQATLIPSASAIRNTRGTAPGWWVEKAGKLIITLPGPPRELTAMWFNAVAPKLSARLPQGGIATRTVKTYGLSEAGVSDAVTEFFDSDNPILGIYAKPDGIHLRLIARGDRAPEMLLAAVAKLEAIFAGYVWGRDDDTLPGVVTGLLKQRGWTLATMEDGSRGSLANIISGDPGIDGLYRGGLVAVSTNVNGDGADSELAESMARRAAEQFSADIGLSTTAISDASDDPEPRRPFLYVGIADRGGVKSWRNAILPYRDESPHRAAVAALFRLRERLLELPDRQR
jgi:nicotinamide-nucleotide amidase